ncbi:FKBP-type peptidyl-prolyl cis-trans isomerase [Xenococcus sp. PCC 7305]|uniref:FKBP-type peptidyl-prolyl cis-trans isomerase n=1 Tax=Xenococcus sp. PCC 7305 TaxID=102125 RepID=UPI001EE71DCB|nr:FKBP-type peptidyl-prolyl cis-trans isomerase [Xenococcus sp. PCC 7305]
MQLEKFNQKKIVELKLKKGVKLVAETEGTGKDVQRQRCYVVAIRLTLNRGEVIKVPNKCLSHSVDQNLQVEDDGFFEHRVRIDRENLIPGIFYAVQGMRVGGYRKVVISPHLGYGERGIPGVIPQNAKLIVEIKILREAD